MKLQYLILSLLILTASSCSVQKTAAVSTQKPIPSRAFDFTYSVSLPNLPKDARVVRIWIPVATSDHHQTVKLLKSSGTVPLQFTQGHEYGDRMAYAEIRNPHFSRMHFTLNYHVRRKEYSVGSFQQLMKYNRSPVQVNTLLVRFVEPDRLIPIDGEIKQVADQATAGKQGEIQKAHAIYNYVFHNMKYEKIGTGWGHGNAVWACNSKHGNCTDFHSLFIGMMRSVHIPARFVIGFPLPPHKSEGVIPGYHCWAEFWLKGKGWVPVDIAEASLHPSKYHFFFGSVDDNRVRFSKGRDITLSPKQAGPPVNYFVYPYVEVNGKPYTKIAKHFSFRETSS